MEHLLKTNDGKYLEVRTFSDQPDKPQLCVIDSQVGGTKVKIINRGTTKMAFHFYYDNTYYISRAGENHLELEKVDTYDSDCYWFEKENIGRDNHYALRTVAEPLRYLVAAPGKKSKLGFSTTSHFCISESTTDSAATHETFLVGTKLSSGVCTLCSGQKIFKL